MASYQVLARKWRPKDFSSLVGQEHIVRALTHALDEQRLHHAYLFSGTRGVGKTTLSRIFAKALNCEKGVSAHPCGVCNACKEIDEGRFVDYVEMDAASHRGVDEMTALLERAIYAPVNARYKVYMIDEVHMLTQHAFNAMLKTLEEPPAHIKFILATTDPQKIPITVLSRCLQFNLKQMPEMHIIEHLSYILNQEKITYAPQALKMIAKAAKGSMRDALSLTDQAIAYSSADLSIDAIKNMLGIVDESYLFTILSAIEERRAADILAIAKDMQLNSFSFSTALLDLASLLHRIAWAQQAPETILEEWFDAEDIRRFANSLSPERLQLYYQIVTVGRHELNLAPDEFSGFTMTLLRLLAFSPLTDHETMFSQPLAAPQISSLASSKPVASSHLNEKTTLLAPSMAPSLQSQQNPNFQSQKNNSTPKKEKSASHQKSDTQEALRLLRDKVGVSPTASKITATVYEDKPNEFTGALDLKKKVSNVSNNTLKKEAPQRLTEPDQATFSAKKIQLDSIGFQGDWPALASALPLKGIVRELALHSELKAVTAEVIDLVVNVPSYTDPAQLSKLEDALQIVLSKKIKVSVKLGEACYTAAILMKIAQQKKQEMAEQSIAEDPFVLKLIEQFDAKVIEGSIRPTAPTSGKSVAP